jgi:emfourin
MHIAFLRSGGFAGIRFSCEINTENLPAEEARQLCDWVDAAKFFDLPEILHSGGADQLQYKISVEQEGRIHAVETDERAMPASLSPLIKWLTAAARRGAAR